MKYLFLIINLLSFSVFSSFAQELISEYDKKGQEFLKAVSDKNIELTKNLLKNGADVLYTGPKPDATKYFLDYKSRYLTAMLLAASKADYKMLAFLLSLGNPQVEKVKETNMINVGSGFYYNEKTKKWERVSGQENQEDIGVPLEAVIKPELYNFDGPKSLGKTSSGLPLFSKEKKDRINAAFQLISQPNINFTSSNGNILSLAIKYGQYDKYEIAKMIINKAIKNKQIGLIINLIPAKTIKYPGFYEGDELPIITALENEAPLEIIKLLLDNGADHNIKGKNKKML